MPSLVPLEPVDYLVIGHLSCDVTPDGPRLGGTAAYAALDGQSTWIAGRSSNCLGGRSSPRCVGWGQRSIPFQPVKVQLLRTIIPQTGRIQYIHHCAPDLSFRTYPRAWRHTPIVHIGPIAGEGKSLVDGHFLSSLIGHDSTGLATEVGQHWTN